MARTIYAENLALLREVIARTEPVREPSEGDASILVDRWFLGTDAGLDPCGRFHHPFSPNGVSDRCERFWKALSQAAERLDVVIERGPDPCDVFIERYVEPEEAGADEPDEDEDEDAASNATMKHPLDPEEILQTMIDAIDPDEELEEDDFDPDEPPPCPACSGPLTVLGVLGQIKHFRCRHCGLEWSGSRGQAN